MDTFVLVFQKGSYSVIEPKKFNNYFFPINPNDKDQRIRFLLEQRGSKRYVQNAPALLRDQGLVYPNLTIYERIRRNQYFCDLHVKISFPKLLKGHSLEDIGNEQKENCVDLLQNRLSDMGVKISKEAIFNSFVQTLHYSANILFPSEEEANMFIERVYKCSLGDWFENNVKTYSNDGHAVRFHTNIFEIIFYLKYKDIVEKGKRSVDRNKTLQERQIAEKLLKSGKIPPLIRMEVRMNGFRSIKSHFYRVFCIKKDRWTLDEVFDYNRSRRLLLYYWNRIIEKSENRILLSLWNNRDICLKIKEKFNNERLKTVAEGMGLFYMLISLGVKDLKAFAELRHNRQAWYRKRRLIATFTQRFAVPNEKLISVVTNALSSKFTQLNLPLI